MDRSTSSSPGVRGPPGNRPGPPAQPGLEVSWGMPRCARRSTPLFENHRDAWASGANGSMDNHSLCHGDRGNRNCCCRPKTLGPKAAARRAEVDRLAGGHTRQHPSQEAGQRRQSSQLETPGLMSGLAGVGYELLRLAASSRVPSGLAMAGVGRVISSPGASVLRAPGMRRA